ncbi:MAG: hypothetical protein AAGJ29_02230 [Pseudomonadota bacterium]
MAREDASGLLAEIVDISDMSRAGVQEIFEQIYADGLVSRDEAEALMDMNRRIQNPDDIWQERFSSVIRDYLLTCEAPIGWISDSQCAWLMTQIRAGGASPTTSEIDLLLDVMRHAEEASGALGRFTLNAISQNAMSSGFVNGETCERIRRALFAAGGDGSIWVTRFEASILFKLNDALGFARNHSAWPDLFSRAVANHLMASAHPDPASARKAFSRELWLDRRTRGIGRMFSEAASSMSDGSWFEKVTYCPHKAEAARIAAREHQMREAEQIDAQEENWLVKHIGADKTATPAEKALLAFLRKEAPGFAQGLSVAA